MSKKVKRSTIVKKLDTIFSQYIRKKNSDHGKAKCFTCGKIDDWKKLQNGHFQSRRHYSTRWMEQNCQVQCQKCNIWNSGEQFIYGQNLDKKFGKGTAEELHIKAHKQIKFQNYELLEMIKKYQDLFDKLK